MRMAILGSSTVLALSGALPASASHMLYYGADIMPLSGSGVSGTAALQYDTEKKKLDVTVNASGLVPGKHLQHIHGKTGADAAETRTPDASDDADGDRVIELAEGLPAYGPILLLLQDPQMPGFTEGFPVLGEDEDSYIFQASYFLEMTQSFNGDFGIADLMPDMLENREIVIHGGNDLMGIGDGTDGEIDGNDGFELVLPVAAGKIFRTEAPAPAPVPLPAAAWLLLASVGGLGAIGARRARRG